MWALLQAVESGLAVLRTEQSLSKLCANPNGFPKTRKTLE
jgi:hypothetical protein